MTLATTAVSEFFWVLGLMSGTSLDGIDAALIYTDGSTIAKIGPHYIFPYDEAVQKSLSSIMGADLPLRHVEPVEHMFTQLNVTAVNTLLQKANMKPEDIRVIGFHGQTLWHKSHRLHGVGGTCQMGDGALLARETGIDVVCDFRSQDVAAGGEGAPLVPIYHHALAQQMQEDVLFINIGGIANITYVPEGGPDHMLAFDTGPGNGLINTWMYMKTGETYDHNGQTAARGEIDHGALAALSQLFHPDTPPPKSFDRTDREKLVFSHDALAGWSLETGAATLTALTAELICKNVKHLPRVPKKWLVCGGGAHNVTLMDDLKRKALAILPQNIEVMVVDAMCIPAGPLEGDLIETQAFAYLAARSLKGLPLSYPGTTGVLTPQCGGRFFSHTES